MIIPKKNVSGSVKIHAAPTNKDNSTITLDQQTRTKPTPAKRLKVDSSKWKKLPLTSKYIKHLKNKFRKKIAKMKYRFKSKSPVEIF